jgi:hypothetical protein
MPFLCIINKINSKRSHTHTLEIPKQKNSAVIFSCTFGTLSNNLDLDNEQFNILPSIFILPYNLNIISVQYMTMI